MEAPSVEQLQRISEQLKQAREQSGIALEEIAAKTYIPLRLLRAMDEGKFERLPEPVFVQGFIKRYADEVGLDGSALAKEFVIAPPALKKPAEEFLSQDPEEEAAAPAPRSKRAPNKFPVPVPLPSDPEPAAPVVEPTSPPPPVTIPAPPTAASAPAPAAMPESFANETPTPTQWQEPSRDRPTGGSKLWYWIGGGLIAALFGMAALALIQPSPQNPNGSNSQTNSPSPKPINSVPPTTTNSPSPSPTPASGAVNLTVQLTDENWMEVEADGKVIDSGVFPKGTQKSWTAQKQLILSVGNAKGMTYSYNQSPPKPVGDSPNPLTLQFPPTATP